MKCIATTVLCLLPLAGCSGWVVVISPTGIGCTTNVNIIPSPTRPPQPRTITSAETVQSACVVADEFNLGVIAHESGRSGVSAESGGTSEPSADDPHQLTPVE